MKKAAEVLTVYEKRIVDLSRRNRLLKYPKNAKSIDFEMGFSDFQNKFGSLNDLQIEFTHRYILDQEMEEDEDEESEKGYVPPTKQNGPKLITLLNSLRLDTKRKFEEHGLHTLFLTFGRIYWNEPLAGKGSSDAKNKEKGEDKDFDYNSPILLIPVIIEEKKNPKKTIVRTYLENNDITVNKVLGLLLEKEYGSRYIELDLKSDEEESIDLAGLMSKLQSDLKEIFSELKIKNKITDEIHIGQYSFYGQQMYQDISEHEEEILGHPFIDALCSHSPIEQKDVGVEIENPDQFLSPEIDYNVTDADPSQLNVIQKVIDGNHLNVQGPPGTGKSQTIVNLISNLLARNKKVLVVCEKHVALEVVLDRLTKAGVGSLCLPLFQYNSDKKTFAKNIIEDRDDVARYYSTKGSSLDAALQIREQKIAHLRDYATALSGTTESLGKSVFWVHGELARLNDLNSEETIPWRGPSALDITLADYKQFMSFLENIKDVFNLPNDENFIHWEGINRHSFSPDFVIRVNHALQDTSEILREYSEEITNPNSPKTLTGIEKLVNENESLNINFKWELKDADLASLRKILDEASRGVNDYISLSDKSGNNFSFPTNWKHSYITKNDDVLDDKSEIANTIRASVELDSLKNSLLSIRDLSKKIKNIELFLSSNLKEILNQENLVLAALSARVLKIWNDKDHLSQLLTGLANLNSIRIRLNEIKLVYEKWLILDTEITSDNGILNRFETKYKHFYRFIFPQYHQDCKVLKTWCNSGDPKAYKDFQEITSAVRDSDKLNSKASILLAKFNKEYLAVGEKLELDNVGNFITSIQVLKECFETNGILKMSDEFCNVVDGSNSKQDIEGFFKAVKNTDRYFNSFAVVFRLPKDLTINYIQKQATKIEAALNSFNNLNSKVDEYTLNQKPKTVGDLVEYSSQIDRLFTSLETVKDYQLEKIFPDKTTEEIIDESADFKLIQNSISQIYDYLKESLTPDDFKKIKLNQAVSVIQNFRNQKDLIRSWYVKFSKALDQLKFLFESELPLGRMVDFEIKNLQKSIQVMRKDKEGLEKWITYRKYYGQIKDLGGEWFFEDTKKLKFVSDPAVLFGRSLWSSWLELYYKDHPVLNKFTVKDHEKIISEFQHLEEEILKINAQRILSNASPHIKYAKQHANDQDREIIHQSQLKMRHKPIRRVVQQCAEQLLLYKPCWMMSPLTLSSYIPFGRLSFDVVIFDEASQMRVEHSLGAISRAKQVIIFGDQNQLPPTSFFDVTSSEDEEDMDEDYESILHATKEILPNADLLLSHHYRSKHEDLIAFSNHYVYGDRLITFPNPNQHQAVHLEYVEDGVFDGGQGGTRRNDKEAHRVAEICAKEALENPGKTIGVISFGKAQEVAIRDAVIDLSKKNPQLQDLLDENSDKPDPFFIKNLESVQGDERDIIVISVGYGKDKEGNIYNRFGPINSQHGYRRLNVAVTRAKEKIICVSSLRSSDIRNAENSRGALLLQKYLEYAEHGVKTLSASKLTTGYIQAEADSPFEEEVERALTERGYKVNRQVGVSGFKIDLAIVNPKNNQEYVLGIECDGASYHSSYSARFNDRIRQEILEKLGWKLYRVWSQHWITHKDLIVEDIINSI